MVNNFEEAWQKVVLKAWNDDKFKKQLLENPEAALKEFGIEIPKSQKIKIIEATPDTKLIHLPPRPTGEELNEEDLLDASGGASSCC